MLKILQARLQWYVNRELPDVQAVFRQGRGSRVQISKIHWIIEKARKFQENIYFCFIDYTKAFDCVDHNKPWKFLKRWEYQTTWPASWEICMQVKKQQLELDKEQQSGSKLGKEYRQGCICMKLLLCITVLFLIVWGSSILFSGLYQFTMLLTVCDDFLFSHPHQRLFFIVFLKGHFIR